MQTVRLFVIAGAALVGGLAYFTLFSGADDVPDDIAHGNGRIEAVQVDVSTKIAGRVEDILVKEGDLVERGQVLAKIDAAQLRAQRLRAQADVASAKSQVAAAQAAVEQARARVVLAEQELARSKALAAKGHTSQEVFEKRVSEAAVANANLEAAKATLVSRERGVDAAEAAEKEIQTQIDDTVLISPTIGRVLYRLAEPGEVVPNGGKLIVLVNLSDIYMEIFVPAVQAHRISIGAEARLKLDIVDVAIPATVSFVSPESQFTPKQVETRDEREKLMFRVKVRVPSELVRQHIQKVKTGIRGVAYVRMEDGAGKSEWPEFLRKLPDGMDGQATGKGAASEAITNRLVASRP